MFRISKAVGEVYCCPVK